jgi:hypothetical protein
MLFLHVSLEGKAQSNLIYSGVVDLAKFDYVPLATLILFTTMLAPLAKILATLPDRGWSASLHTYLTECLVSVVRKTQLIMPIRSARNAMVRLGVFAALWIAAFATLPTLPVSAALIGWIIPKIRWVNLEFQNISDT